MLFRKLDEWIEQHVAILGSALIALVLVLYIISQFVPDISQWIITRGFFNVLLIALIIDLLHRVIELKGSPSSLETYEHQAQALPRIQEFIEKERPETCDLLEYSTSSTRALLQELRKANVRMRLLICHPEKAVSPHERKTIELGIENIRRDFKNYRRITVRQYRAPASLRGRNIGGKLINVGWYLYSITEDEVVDIRGHDIMMLTSDANTPQGHKLKEMFSRAFDALWNDPTTVELALTSGAQGSDARTPDVPRLRPRRSS
jgi:hypothetical protein